MDLPPIGILVLFWMSVVVIFSPAILPIAFLVYAIRQRRFSLSTLMVFITAESIALTAAPWLYYIVTDTRE